MPTSTLRSALVPRPIYWEPVNLPGAGKAAASADANTIRAATPDQRCCQRKLSYRQYRPQTPQTLPQASKATTLTAPTCPCHLFFRGFKTAVGPPSNPPNASNPPAGLQGNNSYSYMPLPSVFPGVQDCRLPALKPPKRFQRSRRPPRQQLLQLHVPAICFSGGSRLPFARPQTPQTLPTLPQASKATTLTDCRLLGLKPPKRFEPSRRPPRQQLLQLHVPAICFSGRSRLPFACRTLTPTCPRTFKTAVCPASNPPNASAGLQGNNSYSYYMPLPSVFQGVQDCRLPALKPPKRFQRSRRPPRQQLLQLRPCHLFFRTFKTAVCSASNPPNASNPPAGLQGNNSYSYMSLPSVFQGVQDCRLPALKPPKRFEPSRRPPRQQLLQLHVPAICFSGRSRLPFACRTLTPTCPRTFKTAVCPASNPPNASAGLQGNNSYSYYMPGLKPPKRYQLSRRPPRQQLLQLHAPAICFSGGSRLPFARPQTPQTLRTLPQASKATTLCHK